MTIAESEEAAVPDLQHAELVLEFVHKKIADVPDLLAVSTDHLAVANVLVRVG